MKTNAIIRIILWSLVIILLVTILGGALLGNSILKKFFNGNSSLESKIKDRISMEEVPVSTELPVTPLESGEIVRIPAEHISNIHIEWAAGKILIQPIDTDEIKFSESDTTDIKNALVWKLRGNTLSISYCKDAVDTFFGFGISTDLSKDLTIYVPHNWTCDTLEIEAASASLEVNNMTIREVELDTASGTCKFDNCSVKELDLDTASGDIRFFGSLDILDCDAASASVYAVLTNVPTRMDLDSMSGDLDITLPEDAGFTANVEGLSADFSSDFDTTTRNGSHVHGDGRCRINVDAMSGDVIIRKAEQAIAETVVPTEIPSETQVHQHTEHCTTTPDSCPDNNIHHDYASDESPTGAHSTHETTHHEENHN